MKYDDIAWHLDSAKSELYAIAHMGLYFRWCIERNLVAEEYQVDPELGKQLQAIQDGASLASEFLMEHLSGKLTDYDFSDEGNKFSRFYYGKRFYSDLRQFMGQSDYEYQETDVDFDQLKNLLDHRLSEWKTMPPSPWWKFWA